MQIRGDFLYCSAQQQCHAVVASSLIHFCSVLNIEGLGEKITYKLLNHGLIKSFKDIFLISVADLVSLERMGEVLAQKLVREIASKKEIPLQIFIRSLGIDEIGANISELIASKFLYANAYKSS